MTDSTRLSPGNLAPHFTLNDQNGKPVSLGDYRGTRVILYFYPTAMTPACTTQACDFRDNLASLQAAGYVVLGVSKDPVETLKEFEEHDGITFPLLSDEDLSVHRSYATWGEKNLYGKIVTGVIRSTFVIAEDGTVALPLYNVKATGHVASLRKRLKLV